MQATYPYRTFTNYNHELYQTIKQMFNMMKQLHTLHISPAQGLNPDLSTSQEKHQFEHHSLPVSRPGQASNSGVQGVVMLLTEALNDSQPHLGVAYETVSIQTSTAFIWKK